MYDIQSLKGDTPTWCPGCGNFSILKALKEVLVDLQLPPHEVLICSGIGQAAKIPHYIRVNGFNGLHGRALPVAVGARMANHNMTVIVESGDGDTYGEGGNHFLHTIRRNPNVAHFVHNNQVYGLTKGQASPTSDQGMNTSFQPKGVPHASLNPLAIALVSGAGFVARAFSDELESLKSVLTSALNFPGYALVDILQPCPSFNKLNTRQWYRERTYLLQDHDPTNWDQALALTKEWDERIPLGIFYQVPRATMESQTESLKTQTLLDQDFDLADLEELQKEFL